MCNYTDAEWNKICIQQAEDFRTAKDNGKGNPEICEDMMNRWLESIRRPTAATGSEGV